MSDFCLQFNYQYKQNITKLILNEMYLSNET